MPCAHQKVPADCPCTYTSCSRHGICCECVAYHRKNKELPACYFSRDAEKDWDRSIEHYLRTSGRRDP